jgi:hypothetical protein
MGARSQRPAAVSDNFESRHLSEALQNRGRGVALEKIQLHFWTINRRTQWRVHRCPGKDNYDSGHSTDIPTRGSKGHVKLRS